MIIGLTGHTNIEKCHGFDITNNGAEYNKEAYDKTYKEIEDSLKKIALLYNFPFEQLTIVSGMARGADEIIADVAVNNNLKLILSIPHTISWHKNRGFSRGVRPQAINYDRFLNYKNTIKKNEIKKEYGGEKYLYANFARNKNIVDESDFLISYKKYNSTGTDHAISMARKVNKYFANIDDINKNDFIKPDYNFKFKYLEKEEKEKALNNLKNKKNFEYNKKSINDNLDNIKTMIIQGCNAKGVMGAGIAAYLKKEYPKQAEEYHKKYYSEGLNVGEVVFSIEEKNLYFGNIISQENVGREKQQVSYEGLHKGLKRVLEFCEMNNIKIIRSPLIGSGLAGGNWGIIEFLYKDVFKKSNIIIEFYEINEKHLEKSFKEMEKREITRNSFKRSDFPKDYDFSYFKFMNNHEILKEVRKYKKEEVKKNYIIKINDNGNTKNENEIYIGRPSIYQNPFPTKSSRFSENKYPHDISMMKFSEERLPYMGVQELISKLKENGELTISCFCINKEITSDNFKLNGIPKCHGEYIAEKVFEEMNMTLEEIKEKKEKRLDDIKRKNENTNDIELN